jgi:hypothetical protein
MAADGVKAFNVPEESKNLPTSSAISSVHKANCSIYVCIKQDARLVVTARPSRQSCHSMLPAHSSGYAWCSTRPLARRTGRNPSVGLLDTMKSARSNMTFQINLRSTSFLFSGRKNTFVDGPNLELHG